MLDEYLIPYFSREDIKKEAEQILFSLCPSMLKKPWLINERNITNLLGLKVLRLPLYKREKTQSARFFCDAEEVVENEEDKTRKVHSTRIQSY